MTTDAVSVQILTVFFPNDQCHISAVIVLSYRRPFYYTRKQHPIGSRGDHTQSDFEFRLICIHLKSRQVSKWSQRLAKRKRKGHNTDTMDPKKKKTSKNLCLIAKAVVSRNALHQAFVEDTLPFLPVMMRTRRTHCRSCTTWLEWNLEGVSRKPVRICATCYPWESRSCSSTFVGRVRADFQVVLGRGLKRQLHWSTSTSYSSIGKGFGTRGPERHAPQHDEDTRSQRTVLRLVILGFILWVSDAMAYVVGALTSSLRVGWDMPFGALPTTAQWARLSCLFYSRDCARQEKKELRLAMGRHTVQQTRLSIWVRRKEIRPCIGLFMSRIFRCGLFSCSSDGHMRARKTCCNQISDFEPRKHQTGSFHEVASTRPRLLSRASGEE